MLAGDAGRNEPIYPFHHLIPSTTTTTTTTTTVDHITARVYR
jgi:hypothetical protein